MDVISLGDRFVNYGSGFDLVALEYGYMIEVIGEHAPGHQARHTAANHYSVITQTIGH
jgi:hypothetical protein